MLILDSTVDRQGFVHEASLNVNQMNHSAGATSTNRLLDPVSLPSLKLSREEVLHVIPLPFKALLDPDHLPDTSQERLSWALFRGEWAYRTTAVGDLPVTGKDVKRMLIASEHGPHEGLENPGVGVSDRQKQFMEYHKPYRFIKPDHTIGEVKQDSVDQMEGQDKSELDVWGLTGWFLNVFMWRMGLWADTKDAGGKALEIDAPTNPSKL